MSVGTHEQAQGPSGLRLALALLAVTAAAVGGYWLLRGDAREAKAREAAQYAELCPRWARLAEELLTFEGSLPERCELTSSDTVFNDTSYVYKATPNIEVAVNVKSDRVLAASERTLDSVHIRDIRSRASVTYNAEALAMIK